MPHADLSPTSGPILPTPRHRHIGYRVAKALLGCPLRLLYRVEVDGLDSVPQHGPVILAANHLSFMDSIFLALTSPRPIAFLAKGEYFDHRLTRWLFRGTGQIPLRRGSPAAGRRALAAASDVLAADGILGVYPEGTRSRDGYLHRGKRGPAQLAATSGAPIVPVGLIGTAQIQAPGERLPHPFRTVHVRYGQPRYVRRQSSTTRAAVLRVATDDVMRDIAALSGQPYIDNYAPVPADLANT